MGPSTRTYSLAARPRTAILYVLYVLPLFSLPPARYALSRSVTTSVPSGASVEPANECPQNKGRRYRPPGHGRWAAPNHICLFSRHRTSPAAADDAPSDQRPLYQDPSLPLSPPAPSPRRTPTHRPSSRGTTRGAHRQRASASEGREQSGRRDRTRSDATKGQARPKAGTPPDAPQIPSSPGPARNTCLPRASMPKRPLARRHTVRRVFPVSPAVSRRRVVAAAMRVLSTASCVRTMGRSRCFSTETMR